MATSDEQRAAVRADVLDWLRGQCNKMTNGECHTRSCMIRGGWKESRDYDCATCHAYEAFTALAANPQQIASEAADVITAFRVRVARLERENAEILDHDRRAEIDATARAELAESQLQQVKADAEQDRDFIRALFNENEWPGGGDLDQFAFQDLAVKHGILRGETRTEPCGEACHCAEYHGSDEMKDGVTCYRKVEWLLDRRNDGTA